MICPPSKKIDVILVYCVEFNKVIGINFNKYFFYYSFWMIIFKTFNKKINQKHEEIPAFN